MTERPSLRETEMMRRDHPPRIVVAIVAAMCLTWSAALAAQQAKPAEDAAATAPPAADPGKPASGHNGLEETADVISIGRVLIEKTNWIGWTFLTAEGLLSIFATTVVLERFFDLRRQKFLPRRFVRRLRDLIARHEDTVEGLRNLCESSEAPVANVLRAGVLRAGRPLAEVEKAMEDATVREASAQRARNRTLSVIGAVAPMVGLLGTVVGMILAFRVTSQVGTGKAEMLAEGIYLALLRTAFGLIIAVPALLFAHGFNNRLERFVREMIEVLEEAIPTFVGMERERTPAAARREEAPGFRVQGTGYDVATS